ncbi:hypothetical protein RB195_014449 [Necator americanus]|uniref:Uncharacterized protein n=1 Tax=Necator americanus TaxID=51031 RepID=A0ABR1E0L9_NECAM
MARALFVDSIHHINNYAQPRADPDHSVGGSPRRPCAAAAAARRAVSVLGPGSGVCKKIGFRRRRSNVQRPARASRQADALHESQRTSRQKNALGPTARCSDSTKLAAKP